MVSIPMKETNPPGTDTGDAVFVQPRVLHRGWYLLGSRCNNNYNNGAGRSSPTMKR